MNRKQAAEIHEHLLDAYTALEHARRAIAGLNKEERASFGDLLIEVTDPLQFEVLQALYDRYPDLEPPPEAAEKPYIDSELRWDEVRLPPLISEKDVDAAIFSVMAPQWRKVAAIVPRARDRCQQLGFEISFEAVAARLQVLAEAGRIEDFGDLRMWRFSEVRLKD
jgi:hypothetical protein